ncbi:hypothetical protein EDD18DRAFT_1208918 [Armillaria luteobubalina]|uniref:Uncharacterized protein n=1 Tax=Armillaria luteobubalina TaxID=153913 RepID=A0AA39UDB7_9AGAR|nr:hypothetical protein EDD18DRAFT_1208918 [Armillaria luteobubalina]
MAQCQSNLTIIVPPRQCTVYYIYTVCILYTPSAVGAYTYRVYLYSLTVYIQLYIIFSWSLSTGGMPERETRRAYVKAMIATELR